MATTGNPTGKDGSELPKKRCDLRMVYLKDVSFEAPNTPGILFGHDQPALEFSVESTYKLSLENHGGLGDVYDVLVTVNVEARAGTRALFLIEVHQGGLFELTGYAGDETDFVLRTRAPEMLYPYARELATSLISRGGFPTVRLRPISFETMYADSLAAESKA